jgi:DNA-directed RNA polymerase subunit M/transcription elongation factor TFIIS
MEFCPKCDYYLVLNTKTGDCIRKCLQCGYSSPDTKGGLVYETIVKERSSEAYKILINEFTKQDPTLPHNNNIKCPRADCPSNSGAAKRDVMIIKTDPVNLKYAYICTVCDERWHSR